MSKANVNLNLQMLDLAWIWIDALNVKQLKNVTTLLEFKNLYVSYWRIKQLVSCVNVTQQSCLVGGVHFTFRLASARWFS